MEGAQQGYSTGVAGAGIVASNGTELSLVEHKVCLISVLGLHMGVLKDGKICFHWSNEHVDVLLCMLSNYPT